MENKKILVADDDPITLTALSHTLKNAGYDVELAEDGQSAWDLLSTSPNDYSLVIADRLMPKIHGMGLLAKIQQEPNLNHLVMIMLTGMADYHEVAMAVQAGVYDFLHKPIDKDLLAMVVARAIRDSKLDS